MCQEILGRSCNSTPTKTMVIERLRARAATTTGPCYLLATNKNVRKRNREKLKGRDSTRRPSTELHRSAGCHGPARQVAMPQRCKFACVQVTRSCSNIVKLMHDKLRHREMSSPRTSHTISSTTHVPGDTCRFVQLHSSQNYGNREVTRSCSNYYRAL